MEGVDALGDELSSLRAAGEVFVWSARHDRGEDAEQAVRELLSAPPAPLNATSEGPSVVERDGQPVDDALASLGAVDPDTARRLVANVLRFDLAYHTEVVDEDTAARLASRVVGALPEPARWWTNGTIGLPGGDSWTGLTDATFDTGVIGVSRDRLLVVWFMDEE